MNESHPQIEKGLEFERLVFFSDAVMAIAITLLAIEIKVPEIAIDLVEQELPRAIADLWPKLLAFFISFVVIGGNWISHHAMFRMLRSYDRRLLWLNLFHLLFVALMPFMTAVVGEYGILPFAQVLYAASVAITLFSRDVVWLYAAHRGRLLDETLTADRVRRVTITELTKPAVFLVSIPFAFISPLIPITIWILAPVWYSIVGRLAGVR